MNKYWSNDDDKKVSYVTEQPLRNHRAGSGEHTPAQNAPQGDAPASFSAGQSLNRADLNAAYRKESAPPPAPRHGQDRSTFITKDEGERQRKELQFAPPPKFGEYVQSQQTVSPLDPYTYGDGYQIHSEQTRHTPDGGGKKRGWLAVLIVLLVLLLIASGAYIFRYQVLDLVGQVFGEEVVWKVLPTPAPAPTETVQNVPAYVPAVKTEMKAKLKQEIGAVTDGVAMQSDTVTASAVVMRAENADGTGDYYLFAADSGRLMGYYEGLTKFVPCTDSVFYMPQPPYLITAKGYPLVDITSFARSVDGDVRLKPMLNGWAIVSDVGGTMLNYVGEDGSLISNLWFSKAFAFTAETTLAYVDTGNVAAPDSRYALYLLNANGETKRLSFAPDQDGVLESVCGMALMANGELRAQDEAMTLLAHADSAAAYVNCGALVVRDPDTKLYGLFVEGVQQYPFAFDSIEPMPSDIQWSAYENGYVRRYTAEGLTYPLPRSYSFVLRSGEAVQVISIAAVSEYPILFD